jgi:hypothetical protein
MPQIKLTKEQALEVLYESDKIIDDSIIEHSRWSVLHKAIFRHDDGFLYRMNYRVGATEYQDESPFEYDTKVTCYMVHEVPSISYEDS